MRAAWRIAQLAGGIAFAVPAHLVARRDGHSRWPTRFLRRAAAAAGVDVRMVGSAVPGHVLLLANHRSWLDILVLAGASGCSFVAKADIDRWPLIGWLGRLHRSVYIERTRRSDARGQADTLRAALARGQSVAMFPEGATNSQPGILPFKPSLIASVFPPIPGVLVQPVRIDYGADEPVVTWPEEESAPANALRMLGRRGRIGATVTFLPPLDPAAFADRKALTLAAHRAIVSA